MSISKIKIINQKVVLVLKLLLWNQQQNPD